jgi:glycosidase
LTADNPGTQNYTISLISDPDTINIPFSFTVPEPSLVEEMPIGIEDGITLTSDTTATLVLYAPGKQHVFVIGDFNKWDFSSDFQMKNTPDGKRWWLELNELEKNTVYGFQYVVDATIRIGDPYTHIVLDPYHDKFIENYNYQGLNPYPYDKTTGIASVLSTKPDTFVWKHDDYIRPDKNRLIIYELLLRDFLEDHSYTSLIDTLDYLERLGINAIEMMPVNEFEGNNSWGYNPSYHLALDKYYGSPDEFKAFVDECHRRGIAVILDIVHNHAFRQSPLVQLYWDDANDRPAADNPWFNQVAKHPFNVGYDFNHESEATKYFTKKALRYWIEEYKVDGYRFDLSKGFTQRQSSNDAQMAAYDASRIAILKDYADHIWEIDPDFYVILEHFATNSEEKELSDNGMMLWGNNNHQYNEATMGYPSNINNLTHKQRGWNDMNLVGYMESHDEERLMYKNLQYGNSSGSYSAKDLETALDRMKLAGAFFFLVPGPKMIWQFVETGYDYSLFTCPDGSVSEHCKLGPKPIKWNYNNVPERKKLFNAYSAMIWLKKKYDVFNTNDFTTSLSSYLKSIHLNDAEMKVAIIGNFDVKSGQIDPKFQNTGIWHDFFSGDSINVTNPNAMITLEAGEFRIYSSKKLDRSMLNGDDEKEPGKKTIIFPNPAGTKFSILPLEIDIDGLEVAIFDISGRLVFIKTLHQNELIDIPLAGLSAGVYIVRLSGKNFHESHKLVVGNL